MDTTPTKLPTVPKHYICATCNIVGNHWIMHCPSMKVNSKALSLDINILNPPSKLNISTPPNASVDSLLKTITPCMTTLHPGTNLQDYKISNGTSNDSHIQLTPSHKRNVTRNCDEFRVDDIGSDNNYDISDDESVISPNSNIIHHREITKTMDIKNTNEHFDNDDENESDVYEFIQNKYLRTPCMTTLHPGTNLQDYKISNGTSNDSHIQLTPSHKRNVTRNCDEFRVDDIGSDNNYDISDDESVISPNSNIIHHREITKTM
eukprot:523205_1